VQFGKEVPTFRRKLVASSIQKMEAPDLSEDFISAYNSKQNEFHIFVFSMRYVVVNKEVKFLNPLYYRAIMIVH
jgi:hypothetical protein